MPQDRARRRCDHTAKSTGFNLLRWSQGWRENPHTDKQVPLDATSKPTAVPLTVHKGTGSPARPAGARDALQPWPHGPTAPLSPRPSAPARRYSRRARPSRRAATPQHRAARPAPRPALSLRGDSGLSTGCRAGSRAPPGNAPVPDPQSPTPPGRSYPSRGRPPPPAAAPWAPTRPSPPPSLPASYSRTRILPAEAPPPTAAPEGHTRPAPTRSAPTLWPPPMEHTRTSVEGKGVYWEPFGTDLAPAAGRGREGGYSPLFHVPAAL